MNLKKFLSEKCETVKLSKKMDWLNKQDLNGCLLKASCIFLLNYYDAISMPTLLILIPFGSIILMQNKMGFLIKKTDYLNLCLFY
jgi:hypothetical protein